MVSPGQSKDYQSQIISYKPRISVANVINWDFQWSMKIELINSLNSYSIYYKLFVLLQRLLNPDIDWDIF